jgi:hypothetical protein
MYNDFYNTQTYIHSNSVVYTIYSISIYFPTQKYLVLSKVWWLMPVIPAHSGGEQAGEA